MEPIVQHSGKDKTAEQIKNIRGFFLLLQNSLIIWIRYVNAQQFLFYFDSQIHSVRFFVAPEFICLQEPRLCGDWAYRRLTCRVRFCRLDTNFTRSISSRVKLLNAWFLLGEAFFLPGGRNVHPRRVGGVCTCQERYSGWMIPLTLLVCVDGVLRELGSPERSWL